jgi:starvation-inducible DNA-binding protein
MATNRLIPLTTSVRRDRARDVVLIADLGSEARANISKILRQLLADIFALYVKTKNFRWHMSGGMFRDHSLMLEEHARQLLAMTDELAERTRKIGGTTIRSIGDISRHQRVKDNDDDFVRPINMLLELGSDNVLLTRSLRIAHEICFSHGDYATASRIGNWIDEAERRVWFLYESARSW